MLSVVTRWISTYYLKLKCSKPSFDEYLNLQNKTTHAIDTPNLFHYFYRLIPCNNIVLRILEKFKVV